MAGNKPRVTIIPSGSDPRDLFNAVATYYIVEDGGALPAEPSSEMREVLNRQTTPQWLRELFERDFAENKLRMRLRELRAKLTPEEWAELEEIERKLDAMKK